MKTELDPHGYAINPNLHDSFVLGIHLEQDTARIEFQSEGDRRRFALILHGLRALRMTEFRLGNIVYGVVLISGKRPSKEDLEPILEGLRPLDLEDNRPANTTYPDRIADEVEQGRATLCIIEPVIGCEMTALCGGYEFVAIGKGREDSVQAA